MSGSLFISTLEAGHPFPLGATLDEGGINFAVFSENAIQIQLCIFDETGNKELARLSLPALTNNIWHGYLPGGKAGLVYGYRAFGPNSPQRGHRFNPHKLLIDPYAKQLSGTFIWSARHFGFDTDLSTLNKQDNAQDTYKAVVINDHFDWEGDQLLHTPLADSILYEAHVKGFTMRHPAVPETLRGTYKGFSSDAIIKHLQRIGITAVSLLPLHQAISEQQINEKGLVNYWGYNTIGFFAPDKRFALDNPVYEFKSMVKELHRAGIEVILDVVYNHTAEGNHLGPTLSFRGLDNYSYYHLGAENLAEYENFTGTGNSVNVHHPRVLQMVMDSLRYWVTEMHVDGFRFDLAPVLGRNKYGFDQRSGFFACLMQDPVLSKVKLIAEPWDIGHDGYQVGKFPPGWSEWNDKFRDTIRTFWTRGTGNRGEVAFRISGSADLFNHDGRNPQASINFITAHDGFSLHDLVSYNRKHNEANGENNNDGTSQNNSWNCGIEGPADLLAINALRARLKRSLLATLFLSQGLPMLLGGDELGRSQQGNNNPYNQDNDISWLQWENVDETLINYVAELISLRAKYPQLRHTHWLQGRSVCNDLKDVLWLDSSGTEMTTEKWQETNKHLFGVLLNPFKKNDPSLLIVMNAEASDRLFTLPEGNWTLVLETAYYPQKAESIIKNILTLKSRSLAVLELNRV